VQVGRADEADEGEGTNEGTGGKRCAGGGDAGLPVKTVVTVHCHCHVDCRRTFKSTLTAALMPMAPWAARPVRSEPTIHHGMMLREVVGPDLPETQETAAKEDALGLLTLTLKRSPEITSALGNRS
jgi:hypothetical protein